MTTLHLGDRTSECNECAQNDYIAEIIKENHLVPETYEGALIAFVSNAPTYYKWAEWEDWFSDFEDAYCGEWSSEQEFADDMADQTITGDLPEIAQIYFDYEKFARDLFMGDYWSSNGYVFRSI